MSDINILKEEKIVPVVVIENLKDAVKTAEAMSKGGINVMEVTLRTEAGLDSIKEIADNCPDIIIGAGTVLNLKQCKQAMENGAKFIVSPGYNEEIVKWCLDNDIIVVPGCVTPTEIMQAIDMGLKIIKFFPSNVYGGLTAMKSLAGPFGDIKFIPTGGVNAENLKEYLDAPFIFAVGGSWLCKKTDITDNEFDKITRLCREAKDIVGGLNG